MSFLEERVDYLTPRTEVTNHIEMRLGELQRRWGVPCLRRLYNGQIVTACKRCGHVLTLHAGDANPAETACLGCTR